MKDLFNDNLFEIQDGVLSRSISAENQTGEKGKGGMADIPEEQKAFHPARDLGRGWKVSPNIPIPAGKETVLCNIEGEGMIKHIWIVYLGKTYRNIILRAYWDDSPVPSIECPLPL